MYSTKTNANYGLWVIMTCQGRFIHCKTCATLVGDVDGEKAVYVGAGSTWEISIPPSILLLT